MGKIKDIISGVRSDAPQIGVDYKGSSSRFFYYAKLIRLAQPPNPLPSPDQEVINSKFEDADKIMMHVANK